MDLQIFPTGVSLTQVSSKLQTIRPIAYYVLVFLLGLPLPGLANEATSLLVPEGEPASLLDFDKPSEHAYVKAVAFSPDGKALAVAASDGNTYLWRIEAGNGQKLAAKLEGHRNAVTAAAFSPDGKLLATGSRDQTVRLWRVETGSVGQLVAELKGHTNEITSVAFGPDGKLLASGSEDQTARLWRVEAGSMGQLVAELKGHTKQVTSVAFDLAGKVLATGSADNTARLWSLAANDLGRLVCELRGHNDAVIAVAFLPDRNLVATASGDNSVRLWGLSPDKLGKQMAATGPPLAHLLSAQGTEPCACGVPLRAASVRSSPSADPNMASLQIFRVATKDFLPRLAELKRLDVRASFVAFSTDGKLLAAKVRHGTAQLWHMTAGGVGSLAAELKGLTEYDSPLAFSPDGKYLAAASQNNTILLWHVAAGKIGQLAAELQGQTQAVTALAFSLDGKTLATGSRDARVRLWRISDDGTGQLRRCNETMTGACCSEKEAPGGWSPSCHRALPRSRCSPWISNPTHRPTKLRIPTASHCA